MNDFGNLAYKIVKYEFKEDHLRFPISYVSGWLETNLGELNTKIHKDLFIDASGNIGPTGLSLSEENIFTKLYTINYYEKASRDAARGILWNNGQVVSVDDWTSIKEGDSSIQRQSKTSISKMFSSFAAQEQQKLENLIYQYNMNNSSPYQVYGEDGD